MINLSTRNYQLLINGLDCSPCLVALAGGFSHYDQSGLVKIDGSLELRRVIGWTESLDDRFNSRWARGKEIKFYVADDTGVLQLAPILGTSYVLDAEYDGIDQLTIQIGCKLTILDYRTPPGEGIDIPLGIGTECDDVAVALLEKAGLSGFVGTIPGSLSVPVSKLGTQSYIGLFGQLCWANNKLAYQGRDGLIYVKPVNLFAPPLTGEKWVENYAVKYERLSGAEKPCSSIITAGAKLETQPPKDSYEVSQEQYGASVSWVNDTPTSARQIIRRGLIRRTILTERVIRGARKFVTKTETYLPVNTINPESSVSSLRLAEIEIETKIYEKQPAGNGIDEGKLLRVEKETRQANGLFLKDFYAANPSRPYFPLNIFISQKSVTHYKYSTPITVTTETWAAIGSLFPNEDLISPTNLVLSQRQTQTWREIRPNDYLFEETIEQPFGIASPAAVEELEATVGVSLALRLSLVQTSKNKKRSNSGQANPPSPERFPTEAEIIEKPIIGTAYLPPLAGSNFREREREFSLPTGLCTSQEQADRAAQIEGAILWGKYKGQSFTLPVSDNLFAVTPLAAVHWVEQTGAIQKFLGDGWSVAFTDRQLIMAADGIWSGLVGYKPTPNPPATFPPDPPPPDPLDPTLFDPAVPLYKQTFTFTCSMALTSEFTYREYALSANSLFVAVLEMGANGGESPLADVTPFESYIGYFDDGSRPALGLVVPPTEAPAYPLATGDLPTIELVAPETEAPSYPLAEGNIPAMELETQGTTAPSYEVSDAPKIALKVIPEDQT